MNKILFTASISKHILRFHLPYLEWFYNEGYIVHVASNGDEPIPFVHKHWNLPFIRSPFSLKHFSVYRALKKLIDQENYVLIHCHTPMASVLTRLAARETRKLGTKVVYTSHGFHFFKGGPLFYWCTYYPIELWLAKHADALVTINSYDYELIKFKRGKVTRVHKIPGIGVNQGKFHPVSLKEKEELRLKNSLPLDAFILVYAAEFINRKNHAFLIDSVKEIAHKIPGLILLFAGRGVLKAKMEAEVERLGIGKYVRFLGFRNDIDQIYKLADVGVSTSKHEGLGLNLVEEMMCGLPIVASEDKGHNEVVGDKNCGKLFNQGDKNGMIEALYLLFSQEKLRMQMSQKAVERSRVFELTNSLQSMAVIYRELL